MANNRGWWKLTTDNADNNEHLELSDDDLEHIAALIKAGFTEGEIVTDEEREEMLEELDFPKLSAHNTDKGDSNAKSRN